MERQSRRRQQALFDNNLTSQKELEQIDNALAKEEKRQKKKEQRRKELEASTSYAVVKTIATWMDKYFLDPLIGFVPVVGDTISSIVGVPFVYMSLFKVKSIPLTLAVVSNILIDVLLGLFPFLGNFFDIFHRSNLKNFKLIKGFVEDDREIIKKVNVRAVWMGFLIALLCWLIYLMIGVLGNVINGVSDKVSMLSSCVRGQADSQEEGVGYNGLIWFFVKFGARL